MTKGSYQPTDKEVGLDLTPSQLKQAAAIKEQIQKLNKELRGILGVSANSERTSTKKRTMSAAAKRKIAAAQRARWAKTRRAKSARSPQIGSSR